MLEKNTVRNMQIRKLQQNLSSIRKIAGWTAEVLGDKIGVTKQTISNLENQKSAMNFTQYIAIRSVLDFEIKNNKENEVLPKVVALLLDSGDELDNNEYNKVQDLATTVAASAVGGIPVSKLNSLFVMLSASIPFIGPIAAIILGSSLSWSKKLFK